MISLHSLTVSL